MGSAMDETRRRIDEVKFRNLGGNMEAIPGFNFEYNDKEPYWLKPAPKPPPPLDGMPQARRASDGAVLRMPYKIVLKKRELGPNGEPVRKPFLRPHRGGT